MTARSLVKFGVDSAGSESVALPMHDHSPIGRGLASTAPGMHLYRFAWPVYDRPFIGRDCGADSVGDETVMFNISASFSFFPETSGCFRHGTVIVGTGT